jgi:hypothetical protein
MRTRLTVLGLALAAGLAAAQPAGTADDDTLRKAGLAADGPALLNYFRLRLVSDAERARILALINRLGDDAFPERQKASAELEGIGLTAVGLLRQAETHPDVEIARRAERCRQRIERVPSGTVSSAAARTLARLKASGAAEVLLAYLPTADDELVAEDVRSALAALAVTDGRPDPALLKALADPMPLRRGAAGEALVRSASPEARAAARPLLADRDPEVRLRLALALVAVARDREGVPALIELLADLPQSQGWKAEEVLCRLAGDDAPKAPLGSDDAARRACRDAWKAWWGQAGPAVDLARLDQAPRLLGFTLLVEMDARGVGGRVRELNPDKSQRWAIDGLQLPVDAQVLPDSRVLIAEHNGAQVTERDFHGKVIWSKRTVMPPLACRRLADGRTFIATRSQVLEADRDGQKEAVLVNRPMSDIVAAARSRGGQVAFLTNTGTCIRLDEKGREARTFNATNRRISYDSALEFLPNGRLLVTQPEGVAEFDPDGKKVWEAKAVRPTSVERLPNGNTLVASMNGRKVQELDRDGHAVWEYEPEDGSRPLRARRR